MFKNYVTSLLLVLRVFPKAGIIPVYYSEVYLILRMAFFQFYKKYIYIQTTRKTLLLHFFFGFQNTVQNWEYSYHLNRWFLFDMERDFSELVEGHYKNQNNENMFLPRTCVFECIHLITKIHCIHSKQQYTDTVFRESSPTGIYKKAVYSLLLLAQQEDHDLLQPFSSSYNVGANHNTIFFSTQNLLINHLLRYSHR